MEKHKPFENLIKNINLTHQELSNFSLYYKFILLNIRLSSLKFVKFVKEKYEKLFRVHIINLFS